jgi:hypothetical protein
MKISKECGLFLLLLIALPFALKAEERNYESHLTRLKKPKPLLADFPQWVEPIRETNRFEAPILVDDKDADLSVRAWRFSYNARGIIEMPNRLRAKDTAIIVVHPWGIDDAQGWRTPEPAGVADFCVPEKNHLAGKHTSEVINPFLKSLRGKVSLVMYSIIGNEDPIRTKMYRSITKTPTEAERREGAAELKAKLANFKYQGEPLQTEFKISTDKPVVDYFKKFPGLVAHDGKYNPKGFWELPIPITSDIDVDPADVLIYDVNGYPALKKFLQENGIRHILLAGYSTDMCYEKTCAGFNNLSQDFNVFLIGDATLATFPAAATPRFTTSAHLSLASIDHLITQISWIKYEPAKMRVSQASTATKKK